MYKNVFQSNYANYTILDKLENKIKFLRTKIKTLNTKNKTLIGKEKNKVINMTINLKAERQGE